MKFTAALLLSVVHRAWSIVPLLLLTACGGSSTGQVEMHFGTSIDRPADMRTVKTDSNFIWQSNGDEKRQRNICIYSYAGLRLDAGELLQKRDSVMRRHIKGATDSIYMVTVRRSVSYSVTCEGGERKLRLAGLWQMENDAMGGPFVCYALVDSARKRVIVADGFVYAPGRKKDILMKRLERVVKTINIKKT